MIIPTQFPAQSNTESRKTRKKEKKKKGRLNHHDGANQNGG